jgi:hypothetical protein
VLELSEGANQFHHHSTCGVVVSMFSMRESKPAAAA